MDDLESFNEQLDKTVMDLSALMQPTPQLSPVSSKLLESLDNRAFRHVQQDHHDRAEMLGTPPPPPLLMIAL